MDTPRSCRAILADTLSELESREAVLSELEMRLGGELSETRAAITAIGHLLRGASVSLQVTTLESTETVQVEVGRKSGDLKRTVIELLRDRGDLMTREQISAQLGVNGRGLSIVIGQALAAGEMIERSAGLGIPSTLLEEER